MTEAEQKREVRRGIDRREVMMGKKQKEIGNAVLGTKKEKMLRKYLRLEDRRETIEKVRVYILKGFFFFFNFPRASPPAPGRADPFLSGPGPGADGGRAGGGRARARCSSGPRRAGRSKGSHPVGRLLSRR